jgi:hypothetical protein
VTENIFGSLNQGVSDEDVVRIRGTVKFADAPVVGGEWIDNLILVPYVKEAC